MCGWWRRGQKNSEREARNLSGRLAGHGDGVRAYSSAGFGMPRPPVLAARV